MHNFYICSPIFEKRLNFRQRVAAKLVNKLRVGAYLLPDLDPTTQMSTSEQRINLWHLAEQVLAYEVPGDFVDVGCFDGKTSSLLARILQETQAGRTLHLYDSFEHRLGTATDPKTALQTFFTEQGLPAPCLHEGRFENTLPSQLPDTIAFAQVDCGIGGDPEEHTKVIQHCLEHLWPRLSPGAICVVQDYHDPASGSGSINYYPYLRAVVDSFLTPRGVRAYALYSGKYSHGFFRKPRA